MRLALVQFNPVVGDVPGNAARAESFIRDAAGQRADLIVLPELALCGYPPKDLLLVPSFLDLVRREALALAHRLRDVPMVVIGAPWRPPEATQPGRTPQPDDWSDHARPTNSLLVLHRGRIARRYDKRLLPTYDVFDEDRYFRAGDAPVVIEAAGVRTGLSICEDLWRGDDVGLDRRYADRADPVADLVRAGARVIINPSASPFVLGKSARQRGILQRHVRAHGVIVAAVNQVGGNDDLIFDGHAAVYAPSPDGGNEPVLIGAGPGFREAVVLVDLAIPHNASSLEPEARAPGQTGHRTPGLSPIIDPLLTERDEALLWSALVLGVRDYAAKTGFKSAVLGLSGGIDSALTACIACAALGAPNVLGVLMPGPYSSRGSIDDALSLAQRLGCRHTTIPITEPHRVAHDLLQPRWPEIAGTPDVPGMVDENLQSRVRGLIVMAISNATGALVLTTGNKSELAVGYCTLYGDMNGGLAVLSDVTKTMVYRLARWLNTHHARCGFVAPPIPEPSITKPPSAELRPDQTDQDTLPPYDVLDAIIECAVERRLSPAQIVQELRAMPGAVEPVVRRVLRMIDLAEYKRKQLCVGLKVTSVTFGPGRRWPIAQRFRADLA